MPLIQWNGKQLEAKVARTMEKRFAQIGMSLVREVKDLISVPGPRARKGYRHIPRSKPGEPPRKSETGNLRRDINQQVAVEGGEPVVRVGTKLKYGRFLEEGTSKMAPRPYLRPTLDRSGRDVARIIGKPL